MHISFLVVKSLQKELTHKLIFSQETSFGNLGEGVFAL